MDTEAKFLKEEEEKLDAAKRQWRRAQLQIGQSLRAKREESSLSMRAIALKIGVSPAFLSDLEQGLRIWSPDRINQFIKHLNQTHP